MGDGGGEVKRAEGFFSVAPGVPIAKPKINKTDVVSSTPSRARPEGSAQPGRTAQTSSLEAFSFPPTAMPLRALRCSAVGKRIGRKEGAT